MGQRFFRHGRRRRRLDLIRSTRRARYLAGAAALFLGACTTPWPNQGPADRAIPSANFDDRRPQYVVLHHTSNDRLDDALRTLTGADSGVSAHYLIGRDGSVVQLVDERRRAWHAGVARWGRDTDLNSASIGIELDNNGAEPFAPPQIDALVKLLGALKARYRIPTANFVGHGDIAPGRKVDPSGFFPWRELALRGFGQWCDPPYPEAPSGFEAVSGLALIGYDTTNPMQALSAWRRHYARAATTGEATDDERNLIFCLSGKPPDDATLAPYPGASLP